MEVLACDSPFTARVNRIADNCVFVNARTHGVVSVSSTFTAVVISEAGNPGRGSWVCVPVRKSIATF
ncbi:hypothetical protein D3C73_1399930 [compost metagenome]